MIFSSGMKMPITKLEINNYNTNYKTKHTKTPPENNQQRPGFITQIF